MDGLNKNLKHMQIIRSGILKSTIKFFWDFGFHMVSPPILHEQIPGKQGEIYLDFQENRFSLNSSNALYLTFYAVMLKKVFAISPTFRDEEISDNHLIEFQMLEVEVEDCTFDGCIDIVKKYITYVIDELILLSEDTVYHERIIKISNTLSIRSVEYEDLINMIASDEIPYGTDLSGCCSKISSFLTTPTFITHYPRKIATWTALPLNGKAAYAFNLMLPEGYGELAEGCQRITDSNYFKNKFDIANITSLNWYVDAVNNSSSNRCGFGIGLDRFTRWLTGSANIKETVLFSK